MIVEQTSIVDIVIKGAELLSDSRELALGMRELRRRLPAGLRWYQGAAGRTLPVAETLAMSTAPLLLVILNPALGISDNLLEELTSVLAPAAATLDCVLPADPRGEIAGHPPVYANRTGLDLFVRGLGTVARHISYDGRQPWVYLVKRTALDRLVRSGSQLSWEEVPGELGQGTVIAQRAFAHSYADYFSNPRTEMLRLVPPGTRTLLDVGGGEGRFARAFMAERGGHSTLVEANPRAAGVARSHGLEVLVGDFLSLPVAGPFDCVTLLDVLEHFDDPFAALTKAHQVLKPGGGLLLSVPNVGHWTVVADLLEGRFDYQPVGILCNTHSSFFTRCSLETLLDDTGFAVRTWENITLPMPASFAQVVARCGHDLISPDGESLATMCFYVLAEKT